MPRGHEQAKNSMVRKGICVPYLQTGLFGTLDKRTIDHSLPMSTTHSRTQPWRIKNAPSLYFLSRVLEAASEEFSPSTEFLNVKLG